MKTTHLILLLSLLFVSIDLSTQSLPAEVTNVVEYRSSRPLSSELRMKVFIDAPGGYVDDRKIKVSEAFAIDEKGDSLRFIPSGWEYFASSTSINLRLELPVRRVKALQQVKGKVKIFTPSSTQNGTTQIANFLTRPRQNLLAKHTNKLKLAVVDSIDYEPFFKELKIAYEASLREQYPNISPQELKAHFEMIELSEIRSQGEGHTLHIITDDRDGDMLRLSMPNKAGKDQVLGGVQLRCPMNKPLAKLLQIENQGFQHLSLHTLTLKDVPTQDWILEVTYASPKHVKEYDFSLSPVILP